MDIIDKRGFCPFRLFREHCTLINSAFVKDLKKLGRNLKDIIIVDNSPISYALNTENGLPILSWYEDKNDKELYKLATVLDFLATVNDVRDHIKKIVVKNELIYEKAIDIINLSKDNQQLEKNSTPYQSKPSTPNTLSFINNKENFNLNRRESTNDQNKQINNTQLKQDSLQPQQINIKIINNNITNFIYNKEKEKEEDLDSNANQNKKIMAKSSMKGINSFRKGNHLMNNNLQHQEMHIKHKKVDSLNSNLNTHHNNNYLSQINNATSKNSQINITGIDFMKNSKKKNIKYSCLFHNNNVTKSEKASDTQPNQKRNKSLKNQNLKKFNSNILHSTSTQEILGSLKRKSSKPGLNSSNHIKSLSYNFDAKINSVRPKSSKQIQQQTEPTKKKQIKDLRSELNEILQKRGFSKSSRANDLKGGFQYQNVPSTTTSISNNINSILNLYTNKI